jgi:hypothetical protein
LLLALTLPRINEHMLSAVVAAVHPSAGAELAVGAKLVDLTVDLTAIAAQDCPPVSHFRMVVRERAWLRELAVARGDEIAVGTRVALFSTDPHEPLDAEPVRELRVAIAGILMQAPAWSGGGR